MLSSVSSSLPATDASTAADPLALVSFPFKLERGETPLATATPTTPALGTPLWAAWGGVALAFLTSALLVRGVLRLSERRASFVSAVRGLCCGCSYNVRKYHSLCPHHAASRESRGKFPFGRVATVCRFSVGGFLRSRGGMRAGRQQAPLAVVGGKGGTSGGLWRMRAEIVLRNDRERALAFVECTKDARKKNR